MLPCGLLVSLYGIYLQTHVQHHCSVSHSQFLHKAFPSECLLNIIFSRLVLCSLLKMSKWLLTHSEWSFSEIRLWCCLSSYSNLIQARTWECCCLLLTAVIFSALTGSRGRPENWAAALHALFHLIVTTILSKRNYFLCFTVKTEAQDVNDLPQVLQFAQRKPVLEPMFVARVCLRCSIHH